VKWATRGFRHVRLVNYIKAHLQVTWVPHAWLLANSTSRLRNFLEKGPSLDLITDETLAAKGDEMEAPTIANVLDEVDRANAHHHTADKAKDDWIAGGPPPDIGGAGSLPPAWSVSWHIPLGPKADPLDGRSDPGRDAPYSTSKS